MDEPAVIEQATDAAAAERPELELNLRHLFVFLAVAEAGSVAGAAERLFRAGSAVTRAVAELEAGLGVRLFERRARGMLLSAYGDVVLVRVRRIAHELGAAAAALDAASTGTASTGAGDLAASRLVFASLPNGRRLAVVAGLAERHSTNAVARELGLTQPAISAALKELEARLGIALFLRSAKGAVPTEAGLKLAFHCSRSLAELRHIVPDLAAMEGEMTGTVRIGALPLGRTRILPQAIAATIARHPRLRVMCFESPYDQLAGQLRSGDIDLILGALRPAAEAADLAQEALFDDRIAVIARAGHPLDGHPGLGIDDLLAHQWVLWWPHSPSRETLQRVFEAAGRTPPRPSVETGDLAILRGVLRHSDLLTAISAEHLHYELAAGDLVVLPYRMDGTRRAIGVAERLGALPPPGARALLGEIRALVARMREAGELLSPAA